LADLALTTKLGEVNMGRAAHIDSGMNSYLSIAAKVLHETRQPLSARQILRAAYQLQIVPSDLYGKTQHKTLHARIAEDILRNKGRSEFVRTEPGRFFLRKFLFDRNIPYRYKKEYLAPLRSDQLKDFYVLCIDKNALEHAQELHGSYIELKRITPFPAKYGHLSTIQGDANIYYVRVIVMLSRGRQLLLHRTPSTFGDSLAGTASVGLMGFVKREDYTLFAQDRFGIQEAASRTLSEQLYMPYSAIQTLEPVYDLDAISCIVDVNNKALDNAIAAVLAYRCPSDTNLDYMFQMNGTRQRPSGVNPKRMDHAQ